MRHRHKSERERKVNIYSLSHSNYMPREKKRRDVDEEIAQKITRVVWGHAIKKNVITSVL